MSTHIENISDGLWEDLKIVLDYIVIKDKALADSFETEETKRNARIYSAAINKNGPIILYQEYYTYDLFASVMIGEDRKFILACLEDPSLVPNKYRASIVDVVEKYVVEHFVEKNNYYRMLMGLPNYETKPSEYLYLDSNTYRDLDIKMIEVDGVVRYPAIHELDRYTQDIIEKTNDFKHIKELHPDEEWLNFIGSDAIPLEQARNANEFEIIRLFPNIDKSNLNEELVNHFSDEYNRSRTWFTSIMWNPDFEQVTTEYRSFVGLCIMIKAIRMTLNRQFDGIIENNFLSDTLINVLFDLYRLPQSIHKLPIKNRRRLALELRKIMRDRAGNKVLYDVARILGFDNIIISKIVLNKIQLFEGENQAVVHRRIESVTNPKTGETQVVDDPYHSYMRQMQAIDIKSKHPTDDIIRQRHIKDYVIDVTEPDPRWWEDNALNDTGIYPGDPDGFLRNEYDPIKKKEFNPQMFHSEIFGNPDDADIPTTDKSSPEYDPLYWEVGEEMRRHPSWYFPGYNSVDTKYMMLTYQYSMAEKMFECIYLMRYLLDKKEQTDTYNVILDTYGGNKPHTLYNVVLFLVCGLNRLMFGPYGPPDTHKDNEYGEIIQNDMDIHRIVGYNVDLTGQEIQDYLDRCSYLDKTTVLGYLEETTLMEMRDIPSAYAIGILGLRDYLVTKMELSKNIGEWRECEKFYNMIFTYDAVRDIHAKEKQVVNNDDDYTIPDIRYRIYDMEVSLFGAKGEIGDAVKVRLETSLVNQIEEHLVVAGFVSQVDENGYITEVNFMSPGELDNYHGVHVWNNPMYNAPSDINLISDVNMDKGDLYNPSGMNGPDIKDGSYPAIIDGIESQDMYIRVTCVRYHTKSLYERYLDELIESDPFLADYISGRYTDEQMALRLSEACEMLEKICDADLNFIRSLNSGGENMEEYLMDMIKYIKSYTIDFITSEKRYILNDKQNPEWLKIHDGIMFDPLRPSLLVPMDILMIYDAMREDNGVFTIYDGKDLPDTEWDHAPFEKTTNRIRDRMMIYHDEDRPNVVYRYVITDIHILEFILAENLKNGTMISDSLSIPTFSGADVIVPIDIYLGNNPGEDGFVDSGFMYRTDKVSMEYLTIFIRINGDSKFPIVLDENVIPDYGKILLSDGGHFKAVPQCIYSRKDRDNPQYLALVK